MIVVTLGVYYFWVRTRVRVFLYGNSSLDGERFTYHGTGRELLVGFLKLIVLAVVALVAASAVGYFARNVLGLAAPIGAMLAGLLDMDIGLGL